MNEADNNSKDSALSPNLERDIVNLTPSKEDKFFPQFKLPRTSIKQYPRKNKYLFQYKMGKPLIYDTNTDNWLYVSNSTSDYSDNSYCTYNSIPMSSRSAKIMRALSHDTFRRKTVGIRKSLNFDSSPSPKKSSSYDETSTSSISTNTSSILNSSLTDSTDSNVPITSMESIDENQNQTPQQSRKYIKISSNKIDIKENKYIRPRTSYLMSLLQQKEKTNKNTNQGISSYPSCSFNPFTGSKGPNCVISSSTPRNLFQEFNQEIDDRPHTPENIMNVVPESISAIKKSHKKEKWYYHEEQSSIQQRNVSTKNDNLYPRTMEFSEIDMIAKTSCSAENESQKKNKNIKRTLIYNNENYDIKSDFDHNVQQKTMSTENDSLESELDQIENDKMQNIDSNDHEENLQDSICFMDDNSEEEEKDYSKENICNEEVSQLSLQKESAIYNISVTSENRTPSPEPNLISQDNNEIITPENNVNMLKHVFTESIKKSHKKIKHGNRKTSFKTKDLNQNMELAKSEISIEGVCNINQDIKSQTADSTCVSSPQNFKFERPSTPENVNSSRLLLLDFNSVKKSHKKDKRSKRTSSFAECHDYEYRKRSSNSLRRSRYEENIGRTLCKNEFLGLKESPSMSPKKKKKSVSMSLQCSTPKTSSAFMSLEYKDIKDEFKICTPIKKLPIMLAVTNYVSADEISQEEDESARTSKEIDCTRCVTPVACFKELRKNEDLILECDNAKRFETDVSISKAADTANLKNKNGRSTPINMSTTELLCNIDSIKKSHKKDKHSHSKRLILKKKRSYIEENGHISFINNEKMLEEPTTLSFKHHVDKHCAEKETCIIMEKDKSYTETDYNNPQPSTSREADDMENGKKFSKPKFLDTPPNSLNAMNLIKLLHTTSIKKSHKKKRDINAQTKYILMSQEHELSDDGSIFDEEEKLNSIENFIENDNNAEIVTM